MSNRLTAMHVFWLFAVGAGFTPSARAVEPMVLSTLNAGGASSSTDSGTHPDGPAASVAPESSFERAFRLRRSWSVAPSWARELEAPIEEREFAPEDSLLTPGDLEGIERRDFAAESRSMVAPAADSEALPEIPIHPSLTDRFYFGVGIYAATSNTQARLNSPSGIGTTVDFESLLGLDEEDIVPQGLARWRMSERWRLELEYFELNRSNTTAISGEITWGDETFPVNTVIDTTFDFAVARLSCGYSFFKRQDKELGVALGFHITDIEASLSAGSASEDEGKLLAPLPVVSMYGQCALTDTWALSGRLDAFRIEYENYAGHVYSLGIDALCQPWRHFGFGFGWRGLDVSVEAENNDWTGEIQTNYSGPIVFATVSF